MDKITYIGPAKDYLGRDVEDYVIVRKDKVDAVNELIDSLSGEEQIPCSCDGSTGDSRDEQGGQQDGVELYVLISKDDYKY